MSDEQVVSEEVVDAAAETTSEAAVETNAEEKSAAVVKPVPEAIKKAQEAKKESEAKAKSDSLLKKAGDPAKAKDGEKAEGSPDGKVVPEKYDLQLPEGVKLNETLMTEFEPLLKGERVSQEGANKLAELHLKGVTEAVSQFQVAQEQAAVDQDIKWEEEIKTELGAKWQEELSHVAKVRDAFLSPATMEFLEKHHLGSNPHFLKDMIKIGKRISEAKVVEGGPGKGQGATADVLYPTMNKK